MGATLVHHAFFDAEDDVGSLDGRQPMSHHNGGSACAGLWWWYGGGDVKMRHGGGDSVVW